MNKKMFGLAVVWFFSLVLAGCGEATTTGSENIALAECLTARGTIMYGTERCPHCQAQKKMFGDAFSKINYVDCDKQESVCTLAGVTGYPTWKFADGTKLAGKQSLEVLSSAAGCDVVPPVKPQQDTMTDENLSGENIVSGDIQIDADDALTGVVITPSTGE